MPQRAPVDYVIVPYDRARHEAFVLDSWMSGGRHDREYMRRRLSDPRIRCAVAMPPPSESCQTCGLDSGACDCAPAERDMLFGWAAADPETNTLEWAYVRYAWGELRGRGIGKALIKAVGIDAGKRIDCPFWSPGAVMLSQSGMPLSYAPTDESRAAMREPVKS